MNSPAVTMVCLLLLQGINGHMRNRNLTGKIMQLDNTNVIVEWENGKCLPIGDSVISKYMNQRRIKDRDTVR